MNSIQRIREFFKVGFISLHYFEYAELTLPYLPTCAYFLRRCIRKTVFTAPTCAYFLRRCILRIKKVGGPNNVFVIDVEY